MNAVKLAPRQRECLGYVYQRLTTKEIAARTGLSTGTIDGYIAEAVTALGARNRRHAAEIIFADQPDSPPILSGGEETGVADPAPIRTSDGDRDSLAEWLELLPIRPQGVPGNDTRPLVRILQILIVAIGIAIGFGMLAVGADVVARLIGR